LACGYKAEYSAENEIQTFPSSVEDVSESGGHQLSDQNISLNTERKLIKTGNISFECKTLVETKKTILEAVKKHNAYVSSDEESRYSSNVTNHITIRIPNQNFDKFLADATKNVTRFDRKEIKVSDVTSEFLDMQARLKTKKELEIRYLELLKKATKISEMLEIEREANNLRSEIESVEGRLKYLVNQVDYSTLTIEFYEKIPGGSGFWYKLTEGFSSGWDYFIEFIISIVSIWPFIILFSILFIIIKRYRKSKKKTSINK